MPNAVIVTGGAGYVGSHACKALAAAGYEPVTYDSLERGHEWAVRWGPLEKGDILDGDRLGGVLKKYAPQCVLHFAGYTYVGESIEQPARYYRNNVLGSRILLETMQKQGVSQIVFSSSCAVYGTPQSLPLTELHPQEPISPYGVNKRDVERLLAEWGGSSGLRHISLRYFNAAGADPDCEIGEQHDPETHLIPLVLQAANGQRPAIDIYGADYATRDGTCIRDYVHVSDLADAHVLALRYLAADGASRSFNVGSEKGSTVLEVIDAARRVTGHSIQTQIARRRAGDPAELRADASLAAATLGWRPRFPDIETQVRHAWQWLRSRLPHRPGKP